MIGALKGIVTALGEDRALIDVGGVGYLVQAGNRTLGRLSAGAPVQLYIETQVREDSFRLYGFLSDLERAWFARLQEVGGVGARVALAVLDVLGPEALFEALLLDDRAAIARANGVGPKLAARIIVDLKGKPPPQPLFGAGHVPVMASPAPAAAPEPDAPSAQRAQAVSALVNLGIAQPDALRAVLAASRTLDGDAPLGALVKAALKEAAA
jgi:holliday junction DNA helicase RuvA